MVRLQMSAALAVVLAACGNSTPTVDLGTDPAEVLLLSGNNQFDTPGSTLGQPLEIRVVDAENRPVPGVPVEWKVAFGAGGSFEFLTDRTDVGGKAVARFVLGRNLGIYEIRAAVPGDPVLEVAFVAFATLDGRPPDFPPPVAVVLVGDDFFDPVEATSIVGRGVKWIWQGSNLHDIVFDDPDAASPVGGGGTPDAKREGSFTVSFNRTGRFTYYCSIHGRDTQAGTIVVPE